MSYIDGQNLTKIFVQIILYELNKQILKIFKITKTRELYLLDLKIIYQHLVFLYFSPTLDFS